jgi:type II secretory pathway pseudopilin PulG
MMNRKAYTLVEAMISVLLLSVVLLGVYGVLQTGNAVFMKDMALLDMQQQTRNAMDRIVREVRQASSQAVDVNYNSTTNDRISFNIPSIPIGTLIRYYLSGTDLVREYPAGTVRKVASNIGVLKFTATGALLEIQIRADKSQYGQLTSFNLNGQVRLRNE